MATEKTTPKKDTPIKETEETAKKENPVMNQEIDSVENEENQKLKRDIELATIRQKQRLEDRANVPGNVGVDMIAEDPRATLARRLVPLAFVHEKKKFQPGQRRRPLVDYKVGSKLSTAYCAPLITEHKKTIAKGWIPVMDEQGQHATEPGGDRLYQRDIVFERDDMEKNTAVSDRAMESVGDTVKSNAPFAGEVEDSTIVQRK